MHHPTDRIAHTTAFVTPVVEHWLEREIAQWVHPMKDRPQPALAHGLRWGKCVTWPAVSVTRPTHRQINTNRVVNKMSNVKYGQSEKKRKERENFEMEDFSSCDSMLMG